jgi:hypothetical protein
VVALINILILLDVSGLKFTQLTRSHGEISNRGHAAYFAKSQIAYKDMEIIAVSKDFGYVTMEQVSRDRLLSRVQDS